MKKLYVKVEKKPTKLGMRRAGLITLVLSLSSYEAFGTPF